MPKEVGIKLTADAAQAVRAFDDTAKAMTGLTRSAKSITSEGADVDRILKHIGETGGEAFQQLIQQAQNEGRSLKDLRNDLVALAAEQKKQSQQAKSNYLEEAQAAALLKQREAERAQGLANFATQVSGSLGQMNSALQQAGQEMASLQRSMKNAFGDEAAANGAVRAIRNLDDEVGMSEESLAQAAITLRKFGAYSDENLTRAAIAAKKTGQSVEEVATAIAKFQAYGDSKSAKGLMKSLGLDPEDMASVQTALDAIDKKFGTTTDGLVSKAALAKGEIGDLLQEIGVHGVNATNSLYEAMLPLAKELHGMPEAFKQVAAEGIALGSGLASVGSTALQAAANFNMAGMTMSGVWAAATGPLGLALIAITGIAAAVRLGIAAMDEQNAKVNAQTAAYEEQNKILRENRDIRIAIAEGKAVDLPKAEESRGAYLEREKLLLKEIGDLEKANWETRSNNVDAPLVNTHKNDEQIANLRKLLENNTRLREEADAAVQKAEQALAKRSPMENSTVQAFVKVFDDLHQESAKKQQERLAKEASEREKAAAKALKSAIDNMEIEDNRHAMTHQAKIERYRQMLQIANLTGEQRIQIEKNIAREEGAAAKQAAAERAAADREREQEREKAHQRELERIRAQEDAQKDLRYKLRELEGKGHENTLEDIQDQAKKYEQAGAKMADIERWKTLAIAEANKKAQDSVSSSMKDQTKELQDQNKLREDANRQLDEQKKKMDALLFKQGGQSVEEAFKNGNFGFSIGSRDSLLGAMSTGREAPATAAAAVLPSMPTAASIEAKSPGWMELGASQPKASAASAGAPGAMAAGTVVINAQSVVVNGASAGGGVSDRDAFYAK